jgi:hypothetical protein
LGLDALALSEPGTDTWPYEAGTSSRSNLVEVTIDRRYEDRHREIEAALADELRAGTVCISYGDVPVYVTDVGPPWPWPPRCDRPCHPVAIHRRGGPLPS